MRGFMAGMLLLLASAVCAQDAEQFSRLTPEQRAWFRNPDGSCVQCSIGMCGVDQNCPQATFLLWDVTIDGEKYSRVRGGSYPSRVEQYCDRRGIPAYNITGSSTYDWMKWASRNKRMCAIGCFSAHFQTLVYYNAAPGDPKPWKVCNNNSPKRIDEYTDAEFRRHHRNSGEWVVILKRPPAPSAPIYAKWW